MATSLIINTTDTAGKSSAKAVPAIDPNATDAQLRTFANSIYALSKNTVDKIYRLDKTDITVDSRDPQLSITPTSVNTEVDLESKKSITITLSYLGEDRTPTVSGHKAPSDKTTVTVTDAHTITVYNGSTGENMGGDESTTMTITLPGNDDYDAASVVFTFTDIDAAEIKDL